MQTNFRKITLLAIAAFAFAFGPKFLLQNFSFQTVIGIIAAVNVVAAATYWFVIPAGRQKFQNMRELHPILFKLMIAAVVTIDATLFVFAFLGLAAFKEVISAVAFFGGPLFIMYVAPVLYKEIQNIRATAN